MKALALLVLVACAPAPLAAGWPRTIGEQLDSAVTVDVTCDEFDVGTYQRASGVIVDGRNVLTAYHVVRCAGIPMVYVETKNGERHRMYVTDNDYADYGGDTYAGKVSRLEIASADRFHDLTTVMRALPQPDEVVCTYPARPSREVRCGHVERVGPSYAVITHGARYGESGSGLYNVAGELVGVVTGKVKQQPDLGFASVLP